MRRQHPFLSPTGIILTVVLLIILALALWRTGGEMFNPGPLTARASPGLELGGVTSHAEIQACSRCHQPLQTQQSVLCVDCHSGIQDEMTTQNGLHARLESVDRCFECHPDHKGVDFNPTMAALNRFDHTNTGFHLVWHQVDYNAAPLGCKECHLGGEFRGDNQVCFNCHGEQQRVFMIQHVSDFGEDCLACHDGVDSMTGFNHQETFFALTGRHAETSCVACHQGGRFDGTPLQCVSCHEEPAVHLGVFEPGCEDCHTPEGWTPASLDGASFDHETQTGFSLSRHQRDYTGEGITCVACHSDDFRELNPSNCVDCHAQEAPDFMSGHLEQFGLNCLGCHDGVDRMHDFDHRMIFPLEGRHADIACVDCHPDQRFAGTPAECVQCHAEPEIHAGVFGLNCQNCHTAVAWQPATLLAHTFPLDHGDEGEIPCLTCHPTTYITYTCDSCHDPAEMEEEHRHENIFDIFGQCVDCHPTGLKDEREKEDD